MPGMQGTTTNGDFLLPFKTGAFLAGAPVQPVILKYGKVCPLEAPWTWPACSFLPCYSPA